MGILSAIRGDAASVGGIPHDGEGSTTAQCGKFLRGELSEDDVSALRKSVSSLIWLDLLRIKTGKEIAKAAEIRAAEKAKLISECLAPLDDNTGAHELAMRQLRLLAAILERLD